MKRKHGFTLIELVVTMVVAVILMTALVPFLPLAQNATYTAQHDTKVALAGEAIYEYIANQLKNADRVFLGDSTANRPAEPDKWNKITVDANGDVTVNGGALYPDGYSQGCIAALSATGLARDQLQLGLTLANQKDPAAPEVEFEKDSAFALANLESLGFGQTEGVVGVPLSVGKAPTQPSTHATAGALVIYYQSAGNLIPEFNPGGGDVVPPSPAPDTLSVLLPSKLSIEVGKTAGLQSRVSLPDGATNVRYTWNIAPLAGYATGTAINSDGLIIGYTLKGDKATDADKKVTLTVTCTVNGEDKTASASCLVEVWEKAADGELHIYQTNDGGGGGWSGYSDVNGTTIFVPLEKYSTGSGQLFPLTAAIRKGTSEHLTHGTWTLSKSGIISSNTISESGPKGANHYNGYTIKAGVVELEFTSTGYNQDGSYKPELEGYKGKVTLIVYNQADLVTDLSFSTSPPSKEYTHLYAGPGEEHISADAVLTITMKSTDQDILQAFRENWKPYFCLVNYTYYGPNSLDGPWLGYQSTSPFIQNPNSVVAGTANAVPLSLNNQNSFVGSIPLTTIANPFALGNKLKGTLSAAIYSAEDAVSKNLLSFSVSASSPQYLTNWITLNLEPKPIEPPPLVSDNNVVTQNQTVEVKLPDVLKQYLDKGQLTWHIEIRDKGDTGSLDKVSLTKGASQEKIFSTIGDMTSVNFTATITAEGTITLSCGSNSGKAEGFDFYLWITYPGPNNSTLSTPKYPFFIRDKKTP